MHPIFFYFVVHTAHEFQFLLGSRLNSAKKMCSFLIKSRVFTSEMIYTMRQCNHIRRHFNLQIHFQSRFVQNLLYAKEYLLINYLLMTSRKKVVLAMILYTAQLPSSYIAFKKYSIYFLCSFRNGDCIICLPQNKNFVDQTKRKTWIVFFGSCISRYIHYCFLHFFYCLILTVFYTDLLTYFDMQYGAEVTVACPKNITRNKLEKEKSLLE